MEAYAVNEEVSKPTFRETLRFWAKLGFISFGGPAGQIAIMHAYVVEKKKWISNYRFMHALNYCMLLPGPEAQQLATYIGWLLHGVWGGLVAGGLFILPSLFIFLGLSILYVSFGELSWVEAIFFGMKPAVIAIIIFALVKISRRSLIDVYHVLLAVLSFVAIFFFQAPFPLIVLASLVAGVLFTRFMPAKTKDERASDAYERSFYLNRYNVKTTRFNPVSLVKVIGAGLILWVIPYLLIQIFLPAPEFWTRMSVFFFQAALVTFGGAYAVLPYVAQVSVEKFHWLSAHEMMDGLALGESTPGPLIMVLTFVGFLGGYNSFGNDLASGTLGLFLSAYYTFLPCFIFIFAGAPLIERTAHASKGKSVLSFISAAVVGVMLNLVLYLGLAVLSPTPGSSSWFSWSWFIIAMVLLFIKRISILLLIGLSALAGCLYHLIF